LGQLACFSGLVNPDTALMRKRIADNDPIIDTILTYPRGPIANGDPDVDDTTNDNPIIDDTFTRKPIDVIQDIIVDGETIDNAIANPDLPASLRATLVCYRSRQRRYISQLQAACDPQNSISGFLVNHQHEECVLDETTRAYILSEEYQTHANACQTHAIEGGMPPTPSEITRGRINKLHEEQAKIEMHRDTYRWEDPNPGPQSSMSVFELNDLFLFPFLPF
jgi:hypothetical protein